MKCKLLIATLMLFVSIAFAGGGGSGGGTPPSNLKAYPTSGTIYYQPPQTGSGNARNSSYTQHLIALSLKFGRPGDWFTGPARGDGRTHAGILELDWFELRNGRILPGPSPYFTFPFFESQCTSYSTLPEYYDDCPTSGISEPSGKLSHGVGSWNASSVSSSTTYWAWIYITPKVNSLLRRNSGDPFDWSLNWSKQEHATPGNPPYAPTRNGTTRCYYTSTERNIWCVQTNRGGYLEDSVQDSRNTPVFRYNSQGSSSWSY